MQPRSNHEYLTTDRITIEKGGIFMALHAVLRDCGVFRVLFPWIAYKGDGYPSEDIDSLYALLTAGRYGDPYVRDYAITQEKVDMAFNCARAFFVDFTAGERKEVRPPLWLVVGLFSGKRRGRGETMNGLLIDRVRAEGYSYDDVRHGLYADFYKIPDNLPERRAEYNLMVDLNKALGGEQNGVHIPELVLVTRNPHTLSLYRYQDFLGIRDQSAARWEELSTVKKTGCVFRTLHVPGNAILMRLKRGDQQA